MTRDEFKAVTGVEPSDTLMEIVNCSKYTQRGMHSACGICGHGIPRTFNCNHCGRYDERRIVLPHFDVEDDSKVIKGYDGVRV